MPYGYVGDISTKIKQSKKNNGVLTVNEVADLQTDGSWGGSMELIEEQDCSGNTTLTFDDIKGAKYDVHFMQFIGVESDSTMYTEIRVSNDGGSNFENSNYERAVQYGGTNGTFGANNSTSADRFSLLGYTSEGSAISHYVYLYNLNNSSKYSFINHQSLPSNTWMYFGGGVYTVAEKIDALQVLNSAGASMTNGKVQLYGIKQI